MIKLFSTIILVLVIILFPPAVLAFVSQNAIPGDSTYPIKIKLEDVILAVASVNPSAKAWFSVDLTDRRFKESTALLAEGKNADTTLSELVSQTSVASAQINELQNQSQKQELQQSLQVDVSKYIITLASTQQQPAPQPLVNNITTKTAPAPSQSTQVSVPTSTPVVSATPSVVRPSVVLSSPTPTPTVAVVSSVTPPSSAPSSDNVAVICASVKNGNSSVDDTIKSLCGISGQVEVSQPEKHSQDNSQREDNPNSGQENHGRDSTR